MSKKEVMNANIQPFTLKNREIKDRIEDAISYDPAKYKKTEILFSKKNTNVHKLPFSDFKVSISQELEEQKLLMQELEEYNLIEEIVVEEVAPVEETVAVEESEIDVLEEIYDFDEETKKPARDKYRAKIKKVDTAAIIAKIKAEAKEKNKGKKVTTRRDINKELKPYLLRKNSGVGINDDTLTSIDIYLNAVNKIESTNDIATPINDSLELNLDEILNDLDK